ncbi:hypothetical protein AMAG_16277 [Allomyces macrogynus ATCC 38327]|uniref:Myb-like domain-containing protein n=1 Tax=Allomyces macrogynus (strain ATCC 38327) TaxID=578462 RepID=A0A0L0TAK8_ALLM3|nr:hypothetical protein AMAG_16277 [Allomyces macrogynus ATCC 38327]|eukprot:KNE71848.1 hypothetical protein AMAG_16277 [Allomyces macrogynus ATCC 38327]
MRGAANRASARWRNDELDVFYQGLSEWGLNFEAIARMLPGKTRVNVRNKYHAELKKNRAKVDQALDQRQIPSLNGYADATGIAVQELAKPMDPQVEAFANRLAQGATTYQAVADTPDTAATAGASLSGASVPTVAAGALAATTGADEEEDEDVMKMSDDEGESAPTRAAAAPTIGILMVQSTRPAAAAAAAGETEDEGEEMKLDEDEDEAPMAMDEDDDEL